MSVYYYNCSGDVSVSDLPNTFTFGIRPGRGEEVVQISRGELLDLELPYAYSIVVTSGPNLATLMTGTNKTIYGFRVNPNDDAHFIASVIPNIPDELMSSLIEDAVVDDDYNPCDDCACEWEDDDGDDEDNYRECDPGDYLYDRARDIIMDEFDDHATLA